MIATDLSVIYYLFFFNRTVCLLQTILSVDFALNADKRVPENAKQTGKERERGWAKEGPFYDQMRQQSGEGRGPPSKL